MPAAVDFEARRFQTAAAHYLSGRPPYPAALIERTVELVGLGPDDRVFDLGCGPAQLAIAFAPHVGQALAMDPEPVMLALARRAAREVPNVEVVEGRSDGLGPELGRFRAAVIGRAFHWMDREDTLRRFETLLEPGGAVALFGDDLPELPENAWAKDYQVLLDRYSADDEYRESLRSPAYTPHTSVLLGSAFSRLERITIIAPYRMTLDTLIDRALSLSATSRARLGDRADELIAELTARASEWSSTGVFTEILASSALIARRPAEV